MNSKCDTKGNAMFAYLGRLEKWQSVQHCCAGTAKLGSPCPLGMFYDSMIHREPLSQEVAKILFVVSRLGNKVRKALLSPCLVPVPCVTPSVLG